MPDGSVPLTLLKDPFTDHLTGPEWSRMGGLTADGDLVALQAAARFAERAAEAATAEALAQAAKTRPVQPRDSADPLDQVAADWAARIDADEKIIHAFLGIDDPIGREADTVFVEADVDASLEAFLGQLPDSMLENGELAALDAFDKALVNGSDAEEALSAAIRAAEQIDASASVAAALAQSPPGVGLGLDTASFSEPEREANPEPDDGPGRVAPEPDPFISTFPAGTFSSFALGPVAARDAAFGFGFQFTTEPVPLAIPATNRQVQAQRVTESQSADPETYISIIGTAAADLLVGSSAKEAIGGREAADYIYADRPTNYDASTHTAANPLANPTFSQSGSDDILAGGAGDDFLWGGAGDDQLHGDVPDTSSALFAEFSFALGSASTGDDSLYGGDGNDSLWGGGGDDVILGAGFLEMAEEDWQRVIDVNMNAGFWLARACLPGMIERGWGRIINFAGMNAIHGYNGRAPVSVSKHGSWGLVKALAKEFGGRGITANIVSPGPIRPEDDTAENAAHIRSMQSRIPAGRLGEPDEVAAAVSLLASAKGGFINGQMIQVNGGTET